MRKLSPEGAMAGIFHVRWCGYAPELNTSEKKGHMLLRVSKAVPPVEFKDLSAHDLNFDRISGYKTMQRGAEKLIVCRGNAGNLIPCPWIDQVVILAKRADESLAKKTVQAVLRDFGGAASHGSDFVVSSVKKKKKEAVPTTEEAWFEDDDFELPPAAVPSEQTAPDQDYDVGDLLDDEASEEVVTQEEGVVLSTDEAEEEEPGEKTQAEKDFDEHYEGGTEPKATDETLDNNYCRVFQVVSILRVARGADGLSFHEIHSYLFTKLRTGLVPPTNGSASYRAFSQRFLRPLKINMTGSCGDPYAHVQDGNQILKGLGANEWRRWLETMLMGFFRPKLFFDLYPFFSRKSGVELAVFAEEQLCVLARFLKRHTTCFCFPRLAERNLRLQGVDASLRPRIVQLCTWNEDDLFKFASMRKLDRLIERIPSLSTSMRVYSKLSSDGLCGPLLAELSSAHALENFDVDEPAMEQCLEDLVTMRYLGRDAEKGFVDLEKEEEQNLLAQALLAGRDKIRLCKIIDPANPFALHQGRVLTVCANANFSLMASAVMDNITSLPAFMDRKTVSQRTVALFSMDYVTPTALATFLRKCLDLDKEVLLYGNPHALLREWRPKVRPLFRALMDHLASDDTTTENPRFAEELAMDDRQLLELAQTAQSSAKLSVYAVDSLDKVAGVYAKLCKRFAGQMFGGMDQVQVVYSGRKKGAECQMQAIQRGILARQHKKYGYDFEDADWRVCHYTNYVGQKVLYSSSLCPSRSLGMVVHTVRGGLNAPGKNYSIGEKRKSVDVFRNKKRQLVFQRRAKLVKSSEDNYPDSAVMGRKNDHVAVAPLGMVHSWTPTDRPFDAEQIQDMGACMVSRRELWKFPYEWCKNDFEESPQHADVVRAADLAMPQLLRCIYVVDEYLKPDELRFLLSITGIWLGIVTTKIPLQLDLYSKPNYYNEQLCEKL